MVAFNAGVYKIENRVNGKLYIGSSCKLRVRRNEHFNALRKGNHSNRKLQRAFDKYGEDNLVFVPIVFCDEGLLIIYEQALIDRYDSVESGYNIIPTAGKTRLGSEHTEQTKNKMSRSHKAKKKSKAHRKAMSEARKGIKTRGWSEEAKEQHKITQKESKKRLGREKHNDNPVYKELKSKQMKEIWAKRRAGIIPMPKHLEKGEIQNGCVQ